ncbi:hypothetical protein [Hoylesella marshii]|uniref:Fibrobacter succinogene major paralogous domain protein n=1 Tax=Hoylesella marshii DSM 16973 = JCM 13450 TaxID=862515 RepID=E0NQI2_9BACT|nr:hypothetical protein [Hoylesella marshii]EFM02622.1 hypothetical protein HMPREF0658_0433 [Hoylesella marshii DSM 16973 = JCM 13450]
MKKLTTFLLLLAGLLATAGCTNDNGVQNNTQEPDTKGMTEFVVVDDHPLSRTAGEYTGTKLKFYWKAQDRLWLNAAPANPAMVRSSRDNISEQLTTLGTTKVATAKFWFQGSYTALTYPIRYTGNGNSPADKVTIHSAQVQQLPADATQIGAIGDCGTAIAQKTGGRYQFTLTHKAAYLTLVPFTTQSLLAGAKITQIKISADKPLAGQFNFDDNGINTAVAPNVPSKSITLKLRGTDNTGFTLPTNTADPATNSATFVLAPGTYGKFYIEYTLRVGSITGTITQTYSDKTFAAGKNKHLSPDLQVTEYPGIGQYYTWDAAGGENYWAGYEAYQPTTHGGYNDNYPKNNTDSRWYNDQAVFPTPASRSCAYCLNANEAWWYIVFNGFWDNSSLWATMGHLYTGGIWLKKQSTIAAEEGKSVAELKTAIRSGTDYTTGGGLGSISNGFPFGKPKNEKLTDYFFLPALGSYKNGRLTNVGTEGFYWSCTLNYNPTNDAAFFLHFYLSSSTSCSVMFESDKNVCAKKDGVRLFSPSNEDEYRPDGM